MFLFSIIHLTIMHHSFSYMKISNLVFGISTFFLLKQVRSGKFASDIGFKTRVSLGDVFEILKLWRCENPFRARYFFSFFFLIFLEVRSIGFLYWMSLSLWDSPISSIQLDQNKYEVFKPKAVVL